jgi:hypothetical protein
MTWPERIRWFSPSGDPGFNDPEGDRMSPELLALLDQMRDEAGAPFVITDGWREQNRQADLMEAGLSDPNQHRFAHPRGEAADGYFSGIPLSLMFAYACRWPFCGIGLYPYTSTGQPVMHLDVMDRERPRSALWIRARSGRYVYAPSREFALEWHLLLSEERARWQPTAA